MEPKFFINRSDDVFEDQYVCNASKNVSDMRDDIIRPYLVSIFCGSLSVLIICGNLLVITSVAYFKQLHTPTNFLTLSLAVADLLVGVLVLPFSAMLAISSCWYLQDLLCKVRDSFDIFLCTASILNLCCISVDRYYTVCQPLRYRTKINVHVTVIMILVSWILSALHGTIITILVVNEVQSNTKCFLFENESLAIIGMGFGFYLPAVIMCTIYLKILTVAQRQARSIQNTTCQSQRTKSESKMERKATKTLAIVMGLFLLCWSPYFLCMTFNPLSNYKIWAPLIGAFKWLGWSNSMLNPFIYGLFYSWFRSAFRMIISGKIFQGDFTHSKLF